MRLVSISALSCVVICEIFPGAAGVTAPGWAPPGAAGWTPLIEGLTSALKKSRTLWNLVPWLCINWITWSFGFLNILPKSVKNSS